MAGKLVIVDVSDPTAPAVLGTVTGNGAPNYLWAPVGVKGPAITLPTVDTSAATSILKSEAVLNGALTDDGGEACDVRFEYGKNPSNLGSATDWQTGFVAGDTFSAKITGLGSTYYFKAAARNSAGTSYGALLYFSTAPTVRPIVTTLAATEIREVTAKLNGSLDYDAGAPCACWFELGMTVDYGVTTPRSPNLTTGSTFDVDVSGLSPGRAYHFRALALNKYGLAVGADEVFSTKAPLGPVTLISDQMAQLLGQEE